MPVVATKENEENGECKGRVASESEEGGGGYLLKENDDLHNGERENSAALKKCMQDVIRQILVIECLSLRKKTKENGECKGRVASES